jgi:hypothetical protein
MNISCVMGRKNGQNTGNMDIDVFLVKPRHFLHLAPYGKSLYRETSSVSFIFCLGFGDGHAHESVLQVAPAKQQ